MLKKITITSLAILSICYKKGDFNEETNKEQK